MPVNLRLGYDSVTFLFTCSARAIVDIYPVSVCVTP